MSFPRRWMMAMLALAALPAGCAHFEDAPHPLYPGPVLPSAQVATLGGYVGKVDDDDVAGKGGTFALLPGCHIVTSRNSVGEDSPSGAWSVVMPRLVFAFRMQAGRSYEIQVQRQGSGSETRDLKMRAVELDANGRKLADVPAIRSKADVQACRQWAVEQAEQSSKDQPSDERPAEQPTAKQSPETNPSPEQPAAPQSQAKPGPVGTSAEPPAP